MNINQPNRKLIIYQLLPRLFGNTCTTNKFYGTIQENGCGKLNDIDEKALQGINELGITHVWYTGVIEHATMTDYSAYGITPDDPDVVKGIAGSPYAIKDYYDIDPDLAVDVPNRILEFENLIKRTHMAGLKAIIDFVPNHVARTYQSDAKADVVRDFGVDDDKTQAFSPTNDFYYVPSQPLTIPSGYNPGGNEFKSPLKDGKFYEYPAKATGDNVFNAYPSINNWFETVKLNYGVDYINGYLTHFNPIPPLWNKMLDILLYWASKGVDGFRCDMVEYVPFEFWGWLIPQVKEKYPELIFIGEAYNIHEYANYLFKGHFDYLYDKEGLYDALKKLTCNYDNATTWDINAVWNFHTNGFHEHMLRFMENHDEVRIASKYFAGDAALAIPGMIVTATLHQGPVMIYAGQEVGEPAIGCEGFSGDDGRTTIFDYWGVPELQKWVNNGQYNGTQLNPEQQQLRSFYSKLLRISQTHDAIKNGEFYELMMANEHQWGFNNKLYLYLRYTATQKVLVVVNFNRFEQPFTVKLAPEILSMFNLSGQQQFTDLLSGYQFITPNIYEGIDVNLPAAQGYLLEFV